MAASTARVSHESAQIVDFSEQELTETTRLRRKHWDELMAFDDDARASRLAELNVYHSIEVLEQHPAIKRAAVGRGLTIHGLIFDIAHGQLKVLGKAGSEAKQHNGIVTNLNAIKEGEEQIIL